MKEQNPDASVIAVYPGEYGYPRMEFGSAEFIAKHNSDAKTFWYLDNETSTFIQLTYIVRKVRQAANEWHTFYFAESLIADAFAPYVDPRYEERPRDPLENFRPHLDEEQTGEVTFFGALAAELDNNDATVSRGKIYAQVLVLKEELREEKNA